MKRLLSLTTLIFTFAILAFGPQPLASAAPTPLAAGTLQFSSAAYSVPENGGSTIFAPGTTPTQSNPNNLQLELGVKFRSDVSGFVTGVRFYKGVTDTSVHSGSLWTSGGTLLANGTFTNETATGWQQLNFASPVAISANTTYIASYFTMSPFFVDFNFFQNQGVDNAPLHALKDGVDGPNGVYHYGPGGTAPSDTYFSSNYWVDVVFTSNPQITITRTGGSTGAVAVSFSTSNGSATAGSDYTGVIQVVNFADGDTASKTVSVPILDDLAVEGNETVNLALSGPTNGATLGSPSAAVLTIIDNEGPSAGTLQFSTAAYSLIENGGSAVITVTRTGGSAGAVGASFATTAGGTASAGADYTSTSQVVSFADGDTAAKTINVPILDDAAVEGNETVNLALTSPTGGAALGSPSTAVLTILDNESAPAGSLQFSAAAYSLPENGITIFAPTTVPAQSSSNNLSVELGVKLRSDVSGFITAIRFYKGASDTSIHTGSLWTTAGALLANGTFTNETATGWQQLNFDAPVAITANTTYIASYHTSTDFFYNVGFFQSQGVDNAPLHALQNGVDGPNGVYRYGSGVVPTDSYFSSNYWVDVAFSSSVSAFVTVTRTGGSAGAVGVSFATSNGTAVAGSDYAALSRTVNFANGDTASKTVSITILDDSIAEGPETVNLALTSPTGGATLGSPNTAVLTIADNESAPAGTLQFSSAAYSLAENGGNATITVTRTGGSSGAVGVHFATSDGTATAGSDYTALSGNVSFADGDTVAKTFSVAVLDDAAVEGNETVNLTLSAPTGGATLGSPSAAVLTIVDNESAPAGVLQFSSATYSLAENGSKTIFAPDHVPDLSVANNTPVELGVKVRSDVSGFITGIRFYKGSTDTSTHTGSLWSSSGTLLANGTFVNESATGWQQLNFNTPVAVTANTTYIASYHTSTSYFYNTHFYENQGVDNDPLHALQDGVDGPNGVYHYGTGVFPTDSYLSTNYWVDVAFSESISAFVTVNRVGGSAGAVGASFATSNGTATAGSDYTAVSRTVNFANGDTASKTVGITLFDDNVLELNETINLALTSPTGGATLGSPNTAVLTIIDNSTNITECGFTIDTPGLYRLTADCDVEAGEEGITIEADSVLLDLDGHTISGPGMACGDESIGVAVEGKHFITIKNGSLINLDIGLRFEEGHHNNASDLTLTGNCTGMFVDDDFDDHYTNINASGNAEYGIVFDHANDNFLTSSLVKNNGVAGLLLDNSGRMNFSGNDFSNNGEFGITTDGVVAIDNNIHNNTSLNNGTFDFEDNNGSCVNTWTSNNFLTDNESGMDFGPGAGCIQ